jgi:nucleoside-diphosphate-sugar epimerase
MKVLITGGTGFLGYYLVQECLKKNFDITCLIRKKTFQTKKKLYSTYSENGIAFVVGDVINFASLSKTFKKDYDLIFHLAGVYSTKKETESVNINGTKNLINALINNEVMPKRFILMSSVAAIGPIKSDAPLDEQTICKPENVYEISKYKSENITKSFANKLNYTIIRAPRIYGANDPQNTFSIFVRLAKLGILPEIKNQISLVYVKNLVQGLLLAGTKPKAIDNTYIICDEKSYEVKEIVATIANILKMKSHFYFSIPKVALQTLEAFGVYKYALRNVRYSIKKAERDLNYKPKYKLHNALIETFSEITRNRK